MDRCPGVLVASASVHDTIAVSRYFDAADPGAADMSTAVMYTTS